MSEDRGRQSEVRGHPVRGTEDVSPRYRGHLGLPTSVSWREGYRGVPSPGYTSRTRRHVRGWDQCPASARPAMGRAPMASGLRPSANKTRPDTGPVLDSSPTRL